MNGVQQSDSKPHQTVPQISSQKLLMYVRSVVGKPIKCTHHHTYCQYSCSFTCMDTLISSYTPKLATSHQQVYSGAPLIRTPVNMAGLSRRPVFMGVDLYLVVVCHPLRMLSMM